MQLTFTYQWQITTHLLCFSVISLIGRGVLSEMIFKI